MKWGLIFAALLPLMACGHKGGLKTPSEIERQEAKKAKKAQEAQENATPEQSQ